MQNLVVNCCLPFFVGKNEERTSPPSRSKTIFVNRCLLVQYLIVYTLVPKQTRSYIYLLLYLTEKSNTLSLFTSSLYQTIISYTFSESSFDYTEREYILFVRRQRKPFRSGENLRLQTERIEVPHGVRVLVGRNLPPEVKVEIHPDRKQRNNRGTVCLPRTKIWLDDPNPYSESLYFRTNCRLQLTSSLNNFTKRYLLFTTTTDKMGSTVVF